MTALIPSKLLDSFPIINDNLYIFKETEDKFKLFLPTLSRYEAYINGPAVKVLKFCNGKHKVRDIINSFERKHKEMTNSKEIIVSFLLDLSSMKIISLLESETRSKGKIFLRMVRTNPHLEGVSWYITNSCNLNCIHCCINAGKKIEDELSTEEAKYLINDLSYAGVYELAVTGGEPLMRSDFFNILRYAKYKIPSLILFTNGTLIDEEKAKKITDIGFSEVAVSLYGSVSTSHEFITNVQGSFNRTIEGITHLTSNGINVKINVVINERNISELEDIIKLAVELKARSIIFSPVDKVGRAIANWEKFGDQEKILRKYFSFFKREAKRYKEKILVYNSFYIQNLNNLASTSTNNEIYCNVGRSSCVILPNGDVIPCDRLRIKVGNIRKQKIKKIWNDSIILRKIRTLTLDSLDECKNCRYKYICRGGCRGRAYSERGSLRAADPFACELFNSNVLKYVKGE